MTSEDRDAPSIHIAVRQVEVHGQGAILLTGPSSSGKGELASSLRRFLSLPPEHHISMGDVLRRTISAARQDEGARRTLRDQCGIDHEVPVIDPGRNPPDLVAKVHRHLPAARTSQHAPSQLDWLEHCVESGLLIPDDWAERLIEAQIRAMANLATSVFILDGYPRTEKAAESLLALFDTAEIEVFKVLHLAITKAEMKSRAQARGRSDDTEKALDQRYEFYVDHVQPCIDYLKSQLGTERVALLDAHQPVYASDGSLDLDRSIRAVTVSALEALGLPRFLLDLDSTD